MGAISPALRVQVEGIRVTYPRWQRIVGEIERCQEWGPVAAEPPCLLVVGPTGAGTSTLVETYARERPAVLTESGVTHPVVTATIPSPATTKVATRVYPKMSLHPQSKTHDALQLVRRPQCWSGLM